jgi:hypothetical protein
LTAVAGNVLTAADFNTSVRDNLLATCTALAVDPLSVGPKWFVTSGKGRVAARDMRQAYIEAGEHCKATQWSDLQTPGPITASVSTGGQMLVSITSYRIIYRVLGCAMISFEVHETDPSTSVTTKIVVPADDSRSLGYQRSDTGLYMDDQQAGMWLIEDLVPEKPYWVKMKYRIELGSGNTDETGYFSRRALTVLAL